MLLLLFFKCPQDIPLAKHAITVSRFAVWCSCSCPAVSKRLRRAGCLDGLPTLNELRLNHCELRALPLGLAAAQRLRILDLGHNAVRRAEDLQAPPVPLLDDCVRLVASASTSYLVLASWCYLCLLIS